ncbi:MAG: MBL fold metallo-hydrolase RNA specificity domain-containing protein [Azonexus sp.]
MLDWLRGFHKAPGHTFVVHGEATASATFAQAIQERLDWPEVRLPRQGEHFTL